VAASFLAQYLVSGDQPSLHPFLLCWVCTSMFSLYLPIIACKQWLHSKGGRRWVAQGGLSQSDLPPYVMQWGV
jgi:hypothetical protein